MSVSRRGGVAAILHFEALARVEDWRKVRLGGDRQEMADTRGICEGEKMEEMKQGKRSHRLRAR